MIHLLAAVGAFLTAVSALLLIAVAAGLGWTSSYLFRDYLGTNFNAAGNSQAVMAVLGGLLGLLVAGTIFGLLAAIYDAQRQIRRLVAVSERCEALLRSNLANRS